MLNVTGPNQPPTPPNRDFGLNRFITVLTVVTLAVGLAWVFGFEFKSGNPVLTILLVTCVIMFFIRFCLWMKKKMDESP